jgi:cytoskeletal protein CcmA (bactofilin family)
MKFRRKSDHAIDVTRLSSLIDRGVEIVGDVVISDGVRIDGRVQGDVRSKADARGLLVLSEHGSIEGSVRVHDAVINGSIIGDLEVEHFVELQPGARVVGNLRYRQLRMECGATVDGRLERLPEPGSTTAVADNVVALPRAQGGDTAL